MLANLKTINERPKNKDIYKYYKVIPLKKRLDLVKIKIEGIENLKLRKEMFIYFKLMVKKYKKEKYTGENDCKYFCFNPLLDSKFVCNNHCQGSSNSMCINCNFSVLNKDKPYQNIWNDNSDELFNQIKPADTLQIIIERLFQSLLDVVKENWRRISYIHYNIRYLRTNRMPKLILFILNKYFERKYKKIKGHYSHYIHVY